MPLARVAPPVDDSALNALVIRQQISLPVFLHTTVSIDAFLQALLFAQFVALQDLGTADLLGSERVVDLGRGRISGLRIGDKALRQGVA